MADVIGGCVKTAVYRIIVKKYTTVIISICRSPRKVAGRIFPWKTMEDRKKYGIIFDEPFDGCCKKDQDDKELQGEGLENDNIRKNNDGFYIIYYLAGRGAPLRS